MTILRCRQWHWYAVVLAVLAVLSLSSSILVVVVVAGAEPEAAQQEQQETQFRPELHLTARIKQHRQGAAGDLVEGEEDLRKIILNWDPVWEAKAYEICHQCGSIDSNSGERKGNGGADADADGGTVIAIPVGRQGECGGLPCLVVGGAPLGWNTFHLRVQLKATTKSNNNTSNNNNKDEEEDDYRWSAWSPARNFNVQQEQLGSVDHSDEL